MESRFDLSVPKKMNRLKGGNTSQVFQKGNFIYRKTKPYSNTVHKLLLHLETKKISCIPKFFGINNSGFEKLSYTAGETMDFYPPTQELKVRKQIVSSAARLLRTFHDATRDFECGDEDLFFLSYPHPIQLMENLDFIQQKVICHNDFAPYNVTFKNNKALGIIDFDTICPAPRIWDLVYAAYRFIPLGNEKNSVFDSVKIKNQHSTQEQQNRELLLHYFFTAYGATCPDDFFSILIDRLRAFVLLFDQECQKGNESFCRMKQEGHQRFYIEEIQYIKNTYL